jgi:hypothetical protein
MKTTINTGVFCAWIVTVGVILHASNVPYRPFVLRPADEGAADQTFAEFRRTLLDRLASGDIAAVLNSMTSELRTEYARLHPEEITGLRRALSLGGTNTEERGGQFGRREFCAPYAYSAYPSPGQIPDDLREAIEDGEAWVIVGANVAVRERPSIRSRVLARMSYNLVPVNNPDREDESGAQYVWQMVQLPNGTWGWVANSFLWGPQDYRVCFARLDGRWQMTTFKRGGIP